MDSDDSRPVDEKRVRELAATIKHMAPILPGHPHYKTMHDTAAALEYLLEVVALIEEDCGDFQMQFWLACCEHPDDPIYCGRCPHCRLNALLSRWQPAEAAREEKP